MSEEKAWRSRSCGDGIRGSSTSGSGADECSDGCERRSGSGSTAALGRLLAAGDSGSGSGWASWRGFSSAGEASSAVLRNRSASGPSRMLARLAFVIREDLLRELPVGVCGQAVGIVLQHRHAFDGRFGEANGPANPRCEYAVAEVLLQQLD